MHDAHRPATGGSACVTQALRATLDYQYVSTVI